MRSRLNCSKTKVKECLWGHLNHIYNSRVLNEQKKGKKKKNSNSHAKMALGTA